MVAYRQPPNLKRQLCHTKLPSINRDKRILPGTKKCGNRPCKMCYYVEVKNEIKSHVTRSVYKNTNSFNCQTTGVIYLISCTKCGKQYVGQTGRRCVDRFSNHSYYVKKNMEATGTHFNSVGHDHSNMRIQIIEKVFPNTEPFRLERERMWIHKLQTKTPKGLNTKD